ncbi:MAG TPA: DUF4982 domain-containing protein [Bacteroides sp.]|nr:DUF4982 domain-containing protein [Bacteroides sp.]
MDKNMIISAGLLAAILFLSPGCATEEVPSASGGASFNDEWLFMRLEEGEGEEGFFRQELDDSGWETVTLPHTPRVEPLVVNDQWQGICWYRKRFSVPRSMEDRLLYLRFEGAMNACEVWINGKKAGEHLGGYLPFTIDFTELALFGSENMLAVRLDNRDNPVTGPKPLENLDFNMYGGIYRNVRLETRDRLHITDPVLADKKGGGGIFVRYPEVSPERALAGIQTHIVNEDREARSYSLLHELLMDGIPVAVVREPDRRLEPGEACTCTSRMEVPSPLLWSPASPYLYLLRTSVLEDGDTVDRVETLTGIRHLEFRGRDFYLNGEKTVLRGVNRHQEYPFIGYALSDRAQYRDAYKIKEAGFDFVRLSHYPHAPAFMDACDELGLLTLDAILGWQYYREDSAFKAHVMQTARDMIRRDRNHPSVLAWEVSLNESWMPGPFIDSLHRIAHEEYPGDQCFSAGWQEYGYDIYIQARQHRLQHYDPDLQKPYIVSEYGDWEYYAMNAGLNQDRWGDLLPEERSSRQLRGHGEKRLLQQATNVQEAHNDNLGTHAFADAYWVMFDYNRGYADDLEASGIMSIFRLPKYSYWFFRSQRAPDEPFGQPMVRLATRWQEDSPPEIRVFSNCREVELLLNGRSLGRRTVRTDRISENLAYPPFHFETGGFEPGTLEARGYIDGDEVALHKVSTPGEPRSLELVADYSGMPWAADGNDVIFIYARVLDDAGTVVPVNDLEVRFETGGNARLVNPGPVVTIAGTGTALVRSGKRAGTFRIVAFLKESPEVRGTFTVEQISISDP